ncbi:ABC transporter permease [Paenibacillus eucommiae]|uniref:ABC-2 type transport system permease protein n=1 Tax=Paenibacillus eucommiae TaxID=1355755 RepID=A0ABS4IQJ6_9BACL|nr:ABC transporter permease [Paenibacillus eucommiae]MBP1989847.1 ABC-2 type transport system permease protein [Paenibacillus eucommiae]
MTIFHFALKRSFSNTTNLLLLTLFPIACIFLPEGEILPYLPYGYHYFGIILLFVGIRLTSIILEDRERGVVKRLAVAPVSYFHYLSQNLLAYAIILIIQCTVVVYGGVLYGQELYQPNALLLLYISFSFTSLALALAWISFYRRRGISFLIYMSLTFLVVLLGGLMMPLEMFPDLLKRIAAIFPTYWLAKGLDWIVFGENKLDFLLINGVLWLYTIVFVIIGSTRTIH